MDPKQLTYDICRLYVEDCQNGPIDISIRNKILGWIRSRRFDKLSACSTLIPNEYSTRESLRFTKQIEAFFKKNSSFVSDESATEALSSFKRAEKICRITNRRLDWYYTKPHRLDEDLSFYLSRMEHYIQSVLGDYKTFMEEIPYLVRLTAGASATRSRRDAQPHLKLGRHVSCNSTTFPYVAALYTYHGYRVPLHQNRVSNRVEFVPKNWKTDRTIACEPDGAMPFQLAFDSYVKKRLRKRRIDLRFQSKNQRMAKASSLDDTHATVDLSMASDTMAFNTVALLLPQEWFQFLNDLRSRYGTINGSLFEYAKFSSMGNGATFGLETLIFAAACHAVGSKNFSVYGDDIIIEKELFPRLDRVFKYLGFVINHDKSYISGPFKESCGVNCYEGVDITPFYLREMDRRKPIMSHNVNGLVSIATPYGKLWDLLADIVQEQALQLVPFNDDSMSGVFITPHHAYKAKLIRSKFSILQHKSYSVKSKQLAIGDLRTLTIWYLEALRGDVGSFERMDTRLPLNFRKPRVARRIIASSVPSLHHKYVSRWVRWNLPPAVTPLHLYGWGDLVLRLET